MSIKVSICVAFFNRSECVLETIQSLLNQNYDQFEVVVVNDGSTDPETALVLDNFNDIRLKVIHQKNTGFVGAIRNAIGHATGDYIAIMGAGDVCDASRIKKQAAVLDAEKSVGIVSCLFENVFYGGDKDGQRRQRNYPEKEIIASDFMKGSNPLGHGEVMFRKTVYEQVGGYRSFFKFSQDLDLWLRMVEHCDVRIIREFLYERRIFIKDGVSTDPKKQNLQKYLAEFARQCFNDRQHLGYDYVERYGVHAGLFRKPSVELSNYSSIKALHALKDDDYEGAMYFINLASNDVLTVKFILVKTLVVLSNFVIGRQLVNILLKLKST
tara:strand:+ start:4168 stop:5145 length:978 start_codon:yes stop_codon:yes gene_type:complete